MLRSIVPYVPYAPHSLVYCDQLTYLFQACRKLGRTAEKNLMNSFKNFIPSFFANEVFIFIFLKIKMLSEGS